VTGRRRRAAAGMKLQQKLTSFKTDYTPMEVLRFMEISYSNKVSKKRLCTSCRDVVAKKVH
jgi:hypothetical protein